GPLGPARTVSTAPKNTLWLPTDLTSTMRQSNAITAEASTGLPVDSVSQSPRANRSPPAMPVRPANMSAISAPPSPSVLTQHTPFPPRAGMGWAGSMGAQAGGGGRARTRQTGVCRRAALAAGTSGGDDVGGRAEPAHRFAKDRGLDGAPGLGSHRREGAVHRIIG